MPTNNRYNFKSNSAGNARWGKTSYSRYVRRHSRYSRKKSSSGVTGLFGDYVAGVLARIIVAGLTGGGKENTPSNYSNYSGYTPNIKRDECHKTPPTVSKEIPDKEPLYDEGIVVLNLPEGLEVIEEGSFWGFKNLKQLKLPSSLRRLNANAFRNCESLTSVKIPEGCRFIGSDCFFMCSSLKDIYIPASVKEIEHDAFCTTCDNTVLHVKPGSYARDYAVKNKLTHSVVCDQTKPGTLDYPSIDEYNARAQKWINDHRSDLTLNPDIEIDGNSFAFISLQNKDFTNKNYEYDSVVKSVKDNGGNCYPALLGDGWFMVVDPGAENEAYDSEIRTLKALKQKVTVILLSDLKKALGDDWKESAMNDACSSLIMNELGDYIEYDEAFENYDGEEIDVEMPSGFKKIDTYAFSGSEITSVVIPEGIRIIDASSFSYCKKLKNIQLPKSLKLLEEEAFSGCESLTCIVIPDGCRRIAKECFRYCDSLKDVYIPASVIEIGEDAFYTSWRNETVLHVKSGSYAEQYAAKNGIKYFAE